MVHGQAQHTPFWKHALLWVAQWLLFWLAWLLLVSSLKPDELLIGLAAAALAATASHLVWSTSIAQLAAHLDWFSDALRLPKQAIEGTWQVLKVLFLQLFTDRKAESILKAVRFNAGGNDPESATRRALAIALTTITPNFIVVGIDREKGLLLYHQIQGSQHLQLSTKLREGG